MNKINFFVINVNIRLVKKKQKKTNLKIGIKKNKKKQK